MGALSSTLIAFPSSLKPHSQPSTLVVASRDIGARAIRQSSAKGVGESLKQFADTSVPYLRQVAAHGLGIKPSEVSKNTTAGAMASIVVDASLAGEVAGIPSLARGVREANEKIILEWSSKLI